MRRVLNFEPNSKIYRRNNYILFIFIGVIGTSLQRFSTFNFQLSTFNFQDTRPCASTRVPADDQRLIIYNSKKTVVCCLLTFSGRSGSAVGLSAISFSAALQKDAAPIPNAERQIRHQMIFRILENPVMSKTDFTSALRFRIANCPAHAANNL